jgi:hypothetical protein
MCGAEVNHGLQRAGIAIGEFDRQWHVATRSQPWQEHPQIDVDVGYCKFEASNALYLVELADALMYIDIVTAE